MKYFSEENLVTLAYEIVKGLAYLNKRGITHRNLSQENILFNKKVFVHEHVFDRCISNRMEFDYYVYVNSVNVHVPYLQVICNTSHIFLFCRGK